MIVALLALLVAMGGTAYAAAKLPTGSVGARQLKADAVTSAKIKDGTIKKTDIKAGVLTQSDASVMVARINAIPFTFDQQLTYGSPSGTSTASTTPDSVAMITPNVALTASDLAVNVTVEVNNNAARRFTLMVNGAESPLTCTIPGLSSICTSTGTAVIPAGSVISIRSDLPAAFNADGTDARLSFLVTAG